VAAGLRAAVQRARPSVDFRRGLRAVSGSVIGGAQEYFDVRAEMVTYGKTWTEDPVGVLCGDGRNSCAGPCQLGGRLDRFARGTSRTSYVHGGVYEFLTRLETDDAMRGLYRDLDRTGTRARRERSRWRGGASGAGRQPVLDMDIYTGASRSTDVSILSARRRTCPELGGHGRISVSLNYTDEDLPRSPTVSCRRPGECSATAVLVRTRDSPLNPSDAACQGNASGPDGLRLRPMGSISRRASRDGALK